MAMAQLVLQLESILAEGESCRHFDWYFDLATIARGQVTDKDLLNDWQFITIARKNEVSVNRPGDGPVVLYDKLLLDALIHLQLVVVWILYAQEAHGGLAAGLVAWKSQTVLAVQVLHRRMTFRKRNVSHLSYRLPWSLLRLLQMIVTDSLSIKIPISMWFSARACRSDQQLGWLSSVTIILHVPVQWVQLLVLHAGIRIVDQLVVTGPVIIAHVIDPIITHVIVIVLEGTVRAPTVLLIVHF